MALTNTTMAVFMSSLDGSIILIALPAIFNGIHLDPLAPANIAYLLWMIMGYRLVQAVFVVNLGRLGDILGRVRIYNLGFVVFTVASILLSLDPFTGSRAALWLIGWRFLQAFGGSMLSANSAAILTDAFPPERRGFALGVNQVAGIAGQFLGLTAGGLLAAWDWRAVFWVNVPVGIAGTLWAYFRLRDNGARHPARIDWWGNATFAIGLSAILVAVTYGVQSYDGHTMGWSDPAVIAGLAGGAALLAVFAAIERRVAEPLFQLRLFRIRAFTAGNLTGFTARLAQGGLQFVLIIWLQGIWLPLHGYDYSQTPFWAGIFVLPLTAGFFIAGPLSGALSDRFGARWFASGGMLLFALSFVGLLVLPVNFPYRGVRPADRPERGGHRDVQLAELLLDHVERAGRVPRRRLRDAVHLPELRHLAVDRGVLLPDDRGPGQRPAAHPHRRSGPARRHPSGRRADRRPPAGLVPVRGHARREPRALPAVAARGAVVADAGQPGPAHRAGVLPEPHLRPVPRRPGPRLRRLRGPRRDRRDRLPHARQQQAVRHARSRRPPQLATQPARAGRQAEPRAQEPLQ